MLLSIWLTAFTFQGKTYRLCVNGRTGEVQGERPYSIWKVGAAILVAVIVGGIVLWLYSQNGGSFR